MKKQLLFIQVLSMTVILASFSFTGKVNAQNGIPNGGFETWTTGSYNDPLYYQYTSNPGCFFTNQAGFNAVRDTPGYHGTYAIQITTTASMLGDTNSGYFANINANGNPLTWTGGMAYNQKPTGIRGYYKNTEMPGDSGVIIVAFSKSGSNIGTYYLTLGGVNAAYTLFSLTFNPPLSVTPDSVAFGATSSNVINNVQLAGSTMTIDSVSFTGVSSQPLDMNGDFESWETLFLYKPNSWFYDGDQNGDGMNRTNDAHSGSYAIELTTYYKVGDHGSAKAESGSVGTGWYPDCQGGNCQEQGGYPFTNQIDTLTFYYKYAPSGNDSAVVQVNFKKNGAQDGGNTMVLGASSSYKYIELPVYANDVPDSVIISLQSSNYNDTALSYVGSIFKIDDISFKAQFTTGVKESNNNNKLAFYPNPFKTFTTLEIDPKTELQGMELCIYDVFGRIVKTMPVQEHKMTLEKDNLSEGIYFYKVSGNNGIMKAGKLIIE